MEFERNKLICRWYHDGSRICDITERLNTSHASVLAALKRWYPKFYDMPYQGKHSKEYREHFYEELYKKYRLYYVPYAQTRTDIIKLMNCTVAQFNKMCEIYHIDYQRLGTYKTQKTLCNVPVDFYESIVDFAKKYHFKSVRQLAVCAINEYMLKYEEEEIDDDTED